jgi:hypothetical protein
MEKVAGDEGPGDGGEAMRVLTFTNSTTRGSEGITGVLSDRRRRGLTFPEGEGLGLVD